jgi:hypothetical protein
MKDIKLVRHNANGWHVYSTEDVDGKAYYIVAGTEQHAERVAATARKRADMYSCKMREVPTLGWMDPLPARHERAVTRDPSGQVIAIDWTRMPKPKIGGRP